MTDTPDDAIVEAVAVALYATDHGLPWEKALPGVREYFMGQARAAIAAYEKAKAGR
jgi:hypothetical protein